jgi:hypothetical protein
VESVQKFQTLELEQQHRDLLAAWEKAQVHLPA